MFSYRVRRTISIDFEVFANCDDDAMTIAAERNDADGSVVGEDHEIISRVKLNG
jgi:hypothetical protein